jgi:hypothetical protein
MTYREELTEHLYYKKFEYKVEFLYRHGNTGASFAKCVPTALSELITLQGGQLVARRLGGIYYHNDKEVIEQFVLHHDVLHAATVKCVPRNSPGTIFRKTSKFTHRSYFNVLSYADTHEILDFFQTQRIKYKLNTLMQSIVNSNAILTPRMWHSDFVDYNDPSLIFALMLHYPNCIRKTVRIVTDK